MCKWRHILKITSITGGDFFLDLKKQRVIPYFLEHSVNILVKNGPSVFRRKYQMVEQNRDIVTLVNVFAHSLFLADAASGGELNPKGLRIR